MSWIIKIKNIVGSVFGVARSDSESLKIFG